ncbi:uncharacterized protein At3g17950-like [Phoenix dactylifera]|uniref:Uncharacterized protein At3g17950-like n=1 Tax=Phoenix dactylifera TaxID=42345 RepID=A0A8B9APR0_PHODC|nr:uncharacterized protein At3g17950-like [Phoenix dactylifera]
MAQQDGGWPLGLQPLSLRVGLTRGSEFSGSSSFSTVITGSPRTSSATSSDFDAESAGSFFHGRSITLGSLIGITNFLEQSFRSLGKSRRQESSKGKKSHRAKTFFSLCLRAHLVKETASNAPSLGHYLEVERTAGASDAHRRTQASTTYELDESTEGRSTPVPNTLFSDGFSVPSQMNGDSSLVVARAAKESGAWVGSDDERRCDKDLSHANGFVSSLLLPCMGGRAV